MKAILSETGFAFNATEYADLYSNEALLKLLRRYTVRTVDRMTKIPKITKLYNVVKAKGFKVIELPRFTMNDLMSKDNPSAVRPITKIDIQLPHSSNIDQIEYVGQSNPNQLIVVDHIVNSLFKRAQVAGLTLKMRAGCGKSYVAKDIIGRMKLKTLIVVPNTYLLDQWVGLLSQYFPKAKIGMLYGRRKEDGDIIVSIINTIADLNQFEVKEKKPCPSVSLKVRYEKISRIIKVDDILKKVGLTIMDESQMYCSKEFRKVFKRIHSRYTIGLSATPDIREDKLDVIHRSWLGPIVDAESLDRYNISQDAFESTANLIEYHAMNEHCKFNIREDGMIDYASIIESIVSDPNRNSLIIDQIAGLMKQGLFTFVFSDRRAHLEYLYEQLELRCHEEGTSANIELPEASRKVILYGGSSEETIDNAKRIGSVIFTTYAYSSTGVSITKMNALVLTTPRRSNMKQIINRVFRLGSDQSIRRIIIDVCDAKLPIKGQQRDRMKAYQERGCEVVRSRVDASEQYS